MSNVSARPNQLAEQNLREWGIAIKAWSRLAGVAAICAATMTLTGCAHYEAPPYQPTHVNVHALKTLPAGKVALGQFTAKSPELNHLNIRAVGFDSPFDNSYAEYLKQALLAELEAAGKIDASAPVLITGELQTNVLDAGLSSTAHISARIVAKRGNDIVFDKVVHGDNEWKSSLIGAIAIPAAQDQYTATVKNLIANLIADPDFRQVF